MFSKKKFVTGYEARKQMLVGIDLLDEIVGTTLGPQGWNVIIDRGMGYPTSTKDGVTAAKDVLPEGISGTGARFVSEAAAKTADTTGDGTTTSTVLAAYLYRKGLPLLDKYRKTDLRDGMLYAVGIVCDNIASMSQRVVGDMVAHVGSVAANNDKEVGDLIATAMRQAGANGVTAVEESKTYETTIDRIEGMQFDQGYISPWFVTDPNKQEAVLDNPFILLYDRALTSNQGLAPLLEQIARTTRPLLILADDVTSESLATFATNKVQGGLANCCVKLPGNMGPKKEFLKDLAALTAGSAILQETGMDLSQVKIEHLGRADKVVITSRTTTIFGGKGKGVANRVAEIKGLLAQNTDDFVREKLQERLAKLTGGITTIKLGAVTEAELRVTKARVEDAMYATKSAIEEGIVPGGGFALLRSSADVQVPSDKNEGFLAGANLVLEACAAPARRILENAQESADEIIPKAFTDPSFNHGYNSLTREYGDMIEMGVIDPAKVVKTALRNAASIASVLLCTNAIELDLPPELPPRR
jgi:chaperonin GroEL